MRSNTAFLIKRIVWIVTENPVNFTYAKEHYCACPFQKGGISVVAD